jgi:3-oxoacyl-[acyl-carrier-protein] synthase-3
MSGVEIVGLGHYAPERVVPNSEIEARLGLAPGWILKRTGIAQRRYAAEGEALSDIAIKAGNDAIAASGIARKKIALLLLATSTPDHLLPPCAPLVAHRLGLAHAGGIDMAGACGGFIYALTLADAFVRAQGKAVIVIAANILSRRINAADRASSVLFADAAGTVILVPGARKDAGLIGSDLVASGSGYDLIKIAGGGSRRPFTQIKDPSETLMVISDGQAVFRQAVDMMTGAAERALSAAKLAAPDVTHFIPHQANERMIAQVAHKLAIDQARMLSTVRDFGNSSAATIPFTLSHEASRRNYKRGDVLLMTAAGAGLTGGAAVWRW